MVDFREKVILITGGSSGIGAACVRHFFNNGGNVIFCSNQQNDGDALEKELNASQQKIKGNATFLFCDVMQEDKIKNVIDKVAEKYDKIDCLVNNVGWHPDHRPIEKFSGEEFSSLFQLNVMSYFHFCRLTLPFLRKVQGSIINISSITALIGQEEAVPYISTKSAINGITKGLAIDEAKFGVRVNSILPSIIDTPKYYQKKYSQFSMSRGNLKSLFH